MARGTSLWESLVGKTRGKASRVVRLFARTSDNRIIMPMSTLFGASYIMWADAYARSVHGAAELPLGIVTAFIGAPFFMFLMIKNGYGGSGK